jgi:DNA-binding response OmpR family regulator
MNALLLARENSDTSVALPEASSWSVDRVATLAAALDTCRTGRFDVICIDLDVVNNAPAEVVGLLRRVTTAPVLLMRRFVDDVDQIVALEAGADAVAPKPLSARLLLAHLRRLMVLGHERPIMTNDVVEYGPLRLDSARQSTTWHGRRVSLCPSEVAIMKALAAGRGRPVARQAILQALGRPVERAHALTSAMSRLRSRLRRQGLHELNVQAVSGHGYRLVLFGVSAPARRPVPSDAGVQLQARSS